jgi:hypothetical protein
MPYIPTAIEIVVDAIINIKKVRTIPHAELMKEIEKQLLVKVIRHFYNPHKVQAFMQMDRKVLYRKLKEHGIEKDEYDFESTTNDFNSNRYTKDCVGGYRLRNKP